VCVPNPMNDFFCQPTVLDLRHTKCPLNFVKAKLAAEKLKKGELLDVWLANNSESALNVPNSLRQEGYQIEVIAAPEPTISVYRVSKP
jgi:TusA-related sulfurtransferase